MAKLSIIKLV